MEARQEVAPKLPAPYFYYRANQDGSIEWGEDCVCPDPVYDEADGEVVYHSGRVYSEAQVLTLLAGRDDLVTELQAAEKIILAMLNAMTPEQKAAVAAKLEADGVSGEGMTRYHERRAALAKATGAV